MGGNNAPPLQSFALRSRVVANRNVFAGIRGTVVAQAPRSHLRRLAVGYAHYDIAVPRPSVLAIVLALLRRVVRMGMILTDHIQFLFLRRLFRVAYIFGGDGKAVARRIFAAVH